MNIFSDCAQFTLYESHPWFVHLLGLQKLVPALKYYILFSRANFSGPKRLGAQISRGPNLLGTKSQGPIWIIAKFLKRSKIWLTDTTRTKKRLMLSCASKEIKTKNYFEYFSDCAQFTVYESHPCFIHHLYHAHSQHQKRSIWQNQKCQNCPKNYLQFMAHQRRNMRRHRLRFCVSYILPILSDFITREIYTKMTSPHCYFRIF